MSTSSRRLPDVFHKKHAFWRSEGVAWHGHHEVMLGGGLQLEYALVNTYSLPRAVREAGVFDILKACILESA